MKYCTENWGDGHKFKTRENPYGRIVSRWSNKRIRRTLWWFSFGDSRKRPRKVKRDIAIIICCPRVDLNSLQRKHLFFNNRSVFKPFMDSFMASIVEATGIKRDDLLSIPTTSYHGIRTI